MFNYFKVICFLWAALGIGSRIAMGMMGEKWSKWELGKAYASKKPSWIYVVGALGYLLVAYTWYQVVVTDVPHSWAIAALISLTVIKISALIFDYETFRSFAAMMLKDKAKMQMLNVSVLILSAGLIAMGVFLY